MRGYFVHPANGGGKLPGVVVIHENRGLNPYIEDVARRLAAENYVAFAPDALTPVGGYPGDEEKATQLFASLDPAKRTEDLLAAVPLSEVAAGMQRPGRRRRLLLRRRHREHDGRSLSRSRGGGAVLRRATERRGHREDQGAAAHPLRGPRRAHRRRMAGVRRRRSTANHVRYQAYMYPGVNHGFHNDTTPRYDEAAAKLAWSRTLAFFNEHLKR